MLAPNSAIPLVKRPTVDELDAILSEPKTLYANRPVKNGAAIAEWALAAGFKKTLAPEDMHVTVAFSKEPLTWPQEDDEGIELDAGGPRSVARMGDQGAVSLKVKCDQLDKRWHQLRDAGASWDYPSYEPHITFTMLDAGDEIPEGVKPYDGPIEFGPEVFQEIGTRGSDWAKKARDSLVGDESPRQAAGVAFITPDSKALFVRYGKDHPQAGKWAFPGGVVEPGEDAQAAAIREAREETGFTTHDSLKMLNRNSDYGADYTTFGHYVEAGFPVRLCDEHDDYTWCSMANPPRPLHPGVEHLLRAGYMPSEEAEGEGEGGEGGGDAIKNQDSSRAATDHALALALDRESVREKDRDGRLRVKSANISKACINPYKGSEIPDWEKLGLDPNHVYQLLRDPEELAKAAQTFNGVQILRKHTPVSAEDAQQWDVVGSTGTSAQFSEPYLTNGLNIWTKEAIDDIESEAKRELSCGYHYRADMTPGEFRGSRFDGVMRDIVGNHVALVPTGRAGPDVVVGDSNEGIKMSETNKALAKTINAVAHRTTSFLALATYLKPRLAADAKVSLTMAFDGVTGAGFKTAKPKIAASIREQAKGKIAKDANLDQVEQVLDMLDAHEIDGGDASVSKEQHGAMEAAANGQSELGIPAKVGAEFTEKDKGKTFDEAGFRGFLKEKGMDDASIQSACDMLPKNGLSNDEESDEDKKKREEEEAKKKAEDSAKAAKDAETMKDMVTKPAMDAAIDTAVKATAKTVRETERGIRAALAEMRPWVGELPATLAFDSADDVYKHVAKMLEVPDRETLHPSALPTIIRMMPKPGERRSSEPIAFDQSSDSAKSFADRFPGASRISAA